MIRGCMLWDVFVGWKIIWEKRVGKMRISMYFVMGLS